MSTINDTLKSTACAMGSLAITAILSWTFVTSTAAVRGEGVASPPARVAKLTVTQRHVWFGQSLPAVLVD